MSHKSVITVQELAGMLAAGQSPIVVDVRESSELVSLPFNGCKTLHIPLGELQFRLNDIPKNKPIYMLCRSGGRSEMAQNILLNAGFTEVYNIVGGTLAWVKEIEASV